MKGIVTVLKMFVELHPQAFPPGSVLNPQIQSELETQLMDFLRHPGKRVCFLPCGIHVGTADVDPAAIPQIVHATEMPGRNGQNRLAA